MFQPTKQSLSSHKKHHRKHSSSNKTATKHKRNGSMYDELSSKSKSKLGELLLVTAEAENHIEKLR